MKNAGINTVVIVGAGPAGQEVQYLGATARYVDFDELQAAYDAVDRDAAREWAERWGQQATPLPAGSW